MPDPPPPSQQSTLWGLLGMSLLLFAVGFLIIGFMLLTSCQTVTVVGSVSSSVVCRYPFRDYGLVSIYVAAVVTILSANLLALSMRSERTSVDASQSRAVVSVFLAIVATVALALTIFWLSLAK